MPEITRVIRWETAEHWEGAARRWARRQLLQRGRQLPAFWREFSAAVSRGGADLLVAALRDGRPECVAPVGGLPCPLCRQATALASIALTVNGRAREAFRVALRRAVREAETIQGEMG